jgi:hypothetical protein
MTDERSKECYWDINTWYRLPASEGYKQYFYAKEIHEDYVLGTFVYLEPTGTLLEINRESKYYGREWSERVGEDEVVNCIEEFNLY